MVVIGVTGGFGTGKSTVAGMFKRLGAVVLDADAITHELMEPKRLAWRQIVKAFGAGVLNDDETVNRRRLAAIVFEHAPRRRQLEAIVHPKVMRAIARRLHELRRARRMKAVVLDVPLLVETGAQRLVDALVVVTASPEVQRQRLRRKYGTSEEELNARMDAQWNLSAKAALADAVVENSGSVESTRTQVRQLWNQLVRNSPRKRPSSTSAR
ncbi:MAG: dephospho-CoA kinase [Candidatus Omnitrophica bacterium]|nr:dephospho-CoA kinase [Candidatus Omnitrophota bacterium]